MNVKYLTPITDICPLIRHRGVIRNLTDEDVRLTRAYFYARAGCKNGNSIVQSMEILVAGIPGDGYRFDPLLAQRAAQLATLDVPFEPLLELQAETDPAYIEDALRSVAGHFNHSDSLKRESAKEKCRHLLKAHGIARPIRLVGAAFEQSSQARSSPADNSGNITIEDPEPWLEAVDGIDLLQEIKDTIKHFIVLPEESAVAAALWVLHAHTYEADLISPYLAILSPVKRCGKTSMLTVLKKMAPRPILSSNISPAALFRSIERYRPTLLIDEADTFLRNNEELRGIMNAGHTKEAAFAIRCVEPDFQPRRFSTWCPKVIAMIGKLPDTLEDRSIICRLSRKGPDDKAERLRADRLETLAPICRKAWRWGRDNLKALQGHEPEIPSSLHDRAADNWHPLLAIAEVIGGDWPTYAQRAAVFLSCQEAGDTESVRELLLADIRDLFEKKETDRLFSEDIVTALCEMDGRPWPEYSYGQPITKTKLAKLLKPFGITSKDVRIETDHAKGYVLEDFQDAFNRYLPHPSNRDNVTTLENIEQNTFSNRDNENDCHGLRSTKTPVNIDLSRCHVSQEEPF